MTAAITDNTQCLMSWRELLGEAAGSIPFALASVMTALEKLAPISCSHQSVTSWSQSRRNSMVAIWLKRGQLDGLVTVGEFQTAWDLLIDGWKDSAVVSWRKIVYEPYFVPLATADILDALHDLVPNMSAVMIRNGKIAPYNWNEHRRIEEISRWLERCMNKDTISLQEAANLIASVRNSQRL